MKSATVHELKKELKNYSQAELVDVCLRLTKFKKENKELLTYLLFEATDDNEYIKIVKLEMDSLFEELNRNNYHLIKKSVRKILKNTKKYIRYSQKKEIEVELLLHFCLKLQTMLPSYRKNVILVNTYQRQIELIRKIVSSLDEDLQYDYGLEIEELMRNNTLYNSKNTIYLPAELKQK